MVTSEQLSPQTGDAPSTLLSGPTEVETIGATSNAEHISETYTITTQAAETSEHNEGLSNTKNPPLSSIKGGILIPVAEKTTYSTPNQPEKMRFKEHAIPVPAVNPYPVIPPTNTFSQPPASASVITVVKPPVDTLSTYSFENYVKDFKKTYSPEELPERERIFKKNLHTIITVGSYLYNNK